MNHEPAIRGRGAAANTQNRFEKIHIEPSYEDIDELAPPPETQYLRMASKSALTRNESPDVGFTYSVNPYAGCAHGCAYCYARPYHEYWSMSAGLDFETKILVKENVAELLRKDLMSPKYTPDVIAMSGVTDCYQPVERELKLTRSCLKVLAEFRNPVAIITKNFSVTRDIDILSAMAQWNGALVFLSITSLDAELSAILEPRAARPQARLDAVSKLREAGIPVGVNAQPMIPGLTDHELPAILKAAKDAGAMSVGYGVVRLPGAVEQIFDQWMQNHRPDARNKVMNRIREVHAGKTSDSRFGTRMHGDGVFAEQLAALFDAGCRKAGLSNELPELNCGQFRRPAVGQLSFLE